MSLRVKRTQAEEVADGVVLVIRYEVAAEFRDDGVGDPTPPGLVELRQLLPKQSPDHLRTVGPTTFSWDKRRMTMSATDTLICAPEEKSVGEKAAEHPVAADEAERRKACQFQEGDVVRHVTSVLAGPKFVVTSSTPTAVRCRQVVVKYGGEVVSKGHEFLPCELVKSDTDQPKKGA